MSLNLRLARIATLIRDAHRAEIYASRYGPLGRTARAAVLRAMRGYTDRQRLVDESLVEALRELGTPAALARDLLAGADAVSADTELGPLWLDPEELLVRPYIQAHGRWDPDLSSFLRRELRPGMCVIDVGANIGYISILAARSVTASGRVLAVEAEPYNAALLRANLFRTGARNVVVAPVAAYRAAGCLHVSSSRYGRSTSTARSAEEADAARSIPVPALRLDDLVDGVFGGRPVDLVKIDTEGADHLVVEGLRQTLAANPRCVVVVELFAGQERLAEGATPADVLTGYCDLGYDLELVGDDGLTRPVEVDDVLAIGRADHDVVLNVVLRRPGQTPGDA